MTKVHFHALLPARKLESNEVVGVVGDLAQLGSWSFDQALILTNREDGWVGTIEASQTRIRYRYFTCVVLPEALADKKLKVTCWEASAQSRLFTNSDQNDSIIKENAFESRFLEQSPLTKFTEVRVHLSSPKNAPFLKFNDTYVKTFRPDLDDVYVEPETSPGCANQRLSIITPYSHSKETVKSSMTIKVPFSSEVHATFQLETSNLETSYIKFNILSPKKCPLGVAILSMSCLNSSKGIVRLPLLDHRFMVIGELRVPYLCIKPCLHEMSMEASCLKSWDFPTMVHVGHRGSGNSFTSEKLGNVRENSIASFLQAGESGAAYVEFDVHLTRDGVPVVYHDLTTLIKPFQKDEGNTQLIELPVNALTLNDLKMLRCYHKSRHNSTRKLEFNEEDFRKCNEPFPTFEELFESVPIQTGFNIEIKWPTLDENHKYEDGMKHYFDANFFVDKILDVVCRCAKSRAIIFSSFDVDICSMVRRKQNHYPVIFLTNGDTKHYTPLLDLRESSNKMAIGAALAEGFVGINTLDKDVYSDRSIVRKTHEANLLFACYGDDITDRLDVIEEASVDIAIYDRIYERFPAK
ncbi:unnamed protein product [Clavelina lepadiformis]|uniref:Glycerophosphocholine phosphodiesterase GPCPD1 n=1 Tax=Clavelina lepadiformis TaxID=159417 RepID=A0ABP0GNI8_CLALP